MDEEEPADRQGLNFAVARERIMQVDESNETRPLRLAKQSREELGDVYNRMVYQKGGAILWMIEHWLGADYLQRGLRDYLASHALANASTADLQSALRVPEGVLNGFLDTTGVPKIAMTLQCDGAAKVTLRKDSGAPPVPVCIRTESVKACAVVDSEPKTIPLQRCPLFVYPNAEGAGYYRIHWTPQQLSTLEKSLEKLTAAERMTLAYDLRGMTNGVLTKLSSDPQPEVAHAAKVSLGIEKEEPPRRRV